MESYEVLTDSEKASSIRSKIKNIQYQKYNAELDALVENAIAEPNQAYLSELAAQIAALDLKQAALVAVLDALPDEV